MNTRIFPRWTNTLARAMVFGFLPLLAALVWVPYAVMRLPLATGVGVGREQPVPFSHARHVRTDAIDCRYCHASVETSSFAGMPPTETCMHCHSQIGVQASVLAPVRDSFRTGQPLVWQRVYHLPDYVHFNHSIHVSKGVGCVTCHGRVDQMAPLTQKFPLERGIPVLWQAEPLTMEWCLTCHRHPERFVRPREQVFNMEWQPPDDQETFGSRLVRQYKIPDARRLTACSTCHF
jgi:Cytochrome c7 and related cytochrome c